jgi:hypothetical protein
VFLSDAGWLAVLGKLLSCQILTVGLGFVGTVFFVPQLDLSVYRGDCLAYVRVEALLLSSWRKLLFLCHLVSNPQLL